MAYIEVINEYKRYHMGDTTIVANDGISALESKKVRSRGHFRTKWCW
jgi:hypothetical protein